MPLSAKAYWAALSFASFSLGNKENEGERGLAWSEPNNDTDCHSQEAEAVSKGLTGSSSDLTGKNFMNYSSVFAFLILTGTTHASDMPVDYSLNNNYPNPFKNEPTTIKFSVPKDGPVDVSVYNVLGQEVADLVNADLDAGIYEVKWSGLNKQGDKVAYVVYFAVINGTDYHNVVKMVGEGGIGDNSKVIPVGIYLDKPPGNEGNKKSRMNVRDGPTPHPLPNTDPASELNLPDFSHKQGQVPVGLEINLDDYATDNDPVSNLKYWFLYETDSSVVNYDLIDRVLKIVSAGGPGTTDVLIAVVDGHGKTDWDTLMHTVTGTTTLSRDFVDAVFS